MQEMRFPFNIFTLKNVQYHSRLTLMVSGIKMLLKTKILAVFIGSFVIVGIILLGQNLRARAIIEETAISEIGTAHKIIWDKILDSANRDLQLYAFKGEPGSGSIWALRGSRSPISAIETKKSTQIERALGKYFDSLKSEGILDHILIYDEKNTLLYHFGTQKQEGIYNVRLDVKNSENQLILASINSRIALQLAFPIFSNGRVIGSVVYAKDMDALAKRFESDTTAQILSGSDTYQISENSVEIKKTKAPSYVFNFLNSEPTYSSTEIVYPFGDNTLSLNIVKDITETVNANNATFVSSLIAISVFMLAISGFVFVILSRGFQPLNSAIEALEALAKGDMSVNIEQKSNDEVGQISLAVQSFRKTAIEFDMMKEKTKISQGQQRDKIYKASMEMAALLPDEVSEKIQADISNTRKKSSLLPENNRLFDTSEDQTLMLVEKIFSRLSKEITDQFGRQVNLTKAYQRFVPKELLINLDKKEITDLSAGDHIKKNVSVLFSDIRAFTTMAEKLSPEKTFVLLNNYLATVIPEITRYGGYVDKYIGDAIMAIFTDDPANSVRSGVEMLKALRRFNETELGGYADPLRIGIGINSGSVIMGTLGTEERLEGTVIGDAVNIAARLESLTKLYKCPMLISDATFQFLQGSNNTNLSEMCRKVDFAEVKGKSEKITIYEVFAWQDKSVVDEKINSKVKFEKAVSVKNSENSELAAELFGAYSMEHPLDEVARQQVFLLKK